MLPKEIYVYEERDRHSDKPCLIAGKKVDYCVQMGEKKEVGVYQLIKVAEVRGEANIYIKEAGQ